MLFRPSFCANCGEKIERSEWRAWTSRRFCEVCETQFKGHDWVPRLIVLFGIIAGIFGFGSYLKSGTASDPSLVKQPRKIADPVLPNDQKSATNANTQAQNAVNLPQPAKMAANVKPAVEQQIASKSPPARQDTDRLTYYCGAETKKGTPCTRRVKGNVRCYQHVGMPAMLPAEKLRIK